MTEKNTKLENIISKHVSDLENIPAPSSHENQKYVPSYYFAKSLCDSTWYEMQKMETKISGIVAQLDTEKSSVDAEKNKELIEDLNELLGYYTLVNKIKKDVHAKLVKTLESEFEIEYKHPRTFTKTKRPMVKSKPRVNYSNLG